MFNFVQIYSFIRKSMRSISSPPLYIMRCRHMGLGAFSPLNMK